MQIVGYHIINGMAVNSLGEAVTIDPLDFLLERKPDSIKVFYHLDYSVANLFRWIGIEKKDILKLLNSNDLYIAPYKFSYMQKKYFNLQYGGGRGSTFANFNDMYQFHRNSDMTELEPVDYARKAEEIGQKVYEALVKINLSPKSLTSPVRCWEKEVLSEMDLPGIHDIPDHISKMAYDCCDGGWVEAFQKGHWDKTWDYDMRSAYGSFTRNLLDTRYGSWQELPYYDPACYYGYALCNIEVTSPFSAITFLNGDEKITPVGRHPKPKLLSKRHIDFAQKYKTANIEILEGHWWFPDKLVYPLESMIDYLFGAKEKATGLEKDAVKRILAGIWGKFLQVNNKSFGDLFNSVWAEDVQSGCRLETAAFILDHHLEKNVLHATVDGILSSKEVPIMETGKIGEWKLSNIGAAYIISSGICAVQGKDGQIDSDKENSDFILRYDWMRNQIAASPNATEYTMSKLSPVTLQKAVTQDKMEKLGRHEEIVKTVDVTFETKRDYTESPETGAQLQKRHYMSRPTDITSILNID